MTEHASTSIAYIDGVLPPADPSISTSHDHEQARPSSVEAAPLTEHAFTSFSYIDVVLPPADPFISTSHDHEQARPSTIDHRGCTID